MKKLTFDRIAKDHQHFEVLNSYIYSETYLQVLKFFNEIKEIEEKHLIILANLIYGAMPTMVRINLENSLSVLKSLNKVKSGGTITLSELRLVKSCINNSLVGTSKMLHFCNPLEYAIWDSRIYRYLSEGTRIKPIGNCSQYFEYLANLELVKKDQRYPHLHKKMTIHFNYPISANRVLEIIMFQTDKLNHQSSKKSL